MSEILEDSFQITLPSNASLDLYPQNRPNSYKTKLAKPVKLGNGVTSDWEVALVDLQFPQNWPNVLEESELAIIVETDRGLMEKEPAPNLMPSADMTPMAGSLAEGVMGDTYFDPLNHYRYTITIAKGQRRIRTFDYPTTSCANPPLAVATRFLL